MHILSKEHPNFACLDSLDTSPEGQPVLSCWISLNAQ